MKKVTPSNIKKINLGLTQIDKSMEIFRNLPEIKNLYAVAESKKLTIEEEEILFFQL